MEQLSNAIKVTHALSMYPDTRIMGVLPKHFLSYVTQKHTLLMTTEFDFQIDFKVDAKHKTVEFTAVEPASETPHFVERKYRMTVLDTVTLADGTLLPVRSFVEHMEVMDIDDEYINVYADQTYGRSEIHPVCFQVQSESKYKMMMTKPRMRGRGVTEFPIVVVDTTKKPVKKPRMTVPMPTRKPMAKPNTIPQAIAVTSPFQLLEGAC